MRQGRIISFRVTDEHHALLVSRSSKGGSPGSYARELMLQALHAEHVVEGIATRLDRHEDQVTAVRRDFARSSGQLSSLSRDSTRNRPGSGWTGH